MSEPRQTVVDESATTSLAEIRRHLAALIARIDTVTPPRPDRITVRRENQHKPGPEWRPVDRWVVRTIDGEAPTVFVETPETWPSGDMLALPVDEVRRLAMALLAAAEWTEAEAASVPRLDRRAVLDVTGDQRG